MDIVLLHVRTHLPHRSSRSPLLTRPRMALSTHPIFQCSVRVLGRSAVVNYVRVVQATDPATGKVRSVYLTPQTISAYPLCTDHLYLTP